MASHSETRAALVASIEHWRENEAATRIEDAKTGSMHCALCAQFRLPHDEDDPHCVGCPVSAHTGVDGCRNTPWHNANAARIDVVFEGVPLSDFTAAARVEREFLEMLLAKFDAKHPAEAEDAA